MRKEVIYNRLNKQQRDRQVIKHIILFMLCCIVQNSFSQQVLLLRSVSASANQAIGLEIQLKNTAAVTAVQFDLSFTTNGVILPTVSDSAVLSNRTNGHSVQLSQIAANTIRVIIFSLSNNPLLDTAGTIVTIKAKTGNIPGVYTASVSNITLADATGQPVAYTLQTGTVTIQAPEISVSTPVDLGRLPVSETYTGYLYVQNTGNQNLIIKSISALSSKITVNNISPVLLPYTLTAGSGSFFTYSITPDNKGIKTDTLVIHSNDPTADSVKNVVFNYTAYPVNSISLSTQYTGTYNAILNIPVAIINYDTITGFQFSISLPDGVTYVNNSVVLNAQRIKDHVVSAGQNGNVLTIVSYSPTNSPYKNNSGKIVSFDLLLNKQGGTYNVPISNCILSDMRGNNVLSDSSNTQLIIESPQISLNTTQIDFGRVTVKQGSSYNLSITNNGTDTLVIKQITLPTNAIKTTNTFPYKILPQSSGNIPFSFSSPQPLTVDSFMLIQSNDPSGDKLLSVKGTVYSKNEISGTITAGFSGSSLRIPLLLTNYDTLQGLQFDVQISDLNSVRFTDSSFRISGQYKFLDYSIQQLDSGTLRLLFYSLSGKKILPDSNWLGEIRLLSLKGETAGGYGNINLLNAVISNNNNQNVSSGVTGNYMNICSVTQPKLSAYPSANICDSAVTISPSSGSLYAWYQNDTLQALPINNRVAIGAAWSAVVNQNGCHYISNSLSTQKLAVPAAPLISVSGNTSVCQGQSVKLISSATSGNQWYKDSSLINDATDTVYTALSGGAYSVKYNNGGCNSLMSLIKTVTVNAVPAAPIVSNIIYPQNAIATPLTAIASAGDTLRWYGMNAAGGTGSVTAPVPLTTTADTTSYYVSQYTTYGCESVRSRIKVIVTQAADSITTLANLSISPGMLNPVFATNITSYTASVSSGTAGITVTPATSDPTATVKVNGTAVVSGETSGAIPLSTGNNTILITVTAQNGSSTETYTITVTKAIPVPTITSFSPATATTGDTVIITGLDFTGVTAVSFGGIPASSFSISSPTSITAVVGAGSTGNVSVTTPAGTGILAGFSFVPEPSVTAGGPTTFITGGSVILTASPGAGYNYQWIKDGVPVNGATEAVYTATQSGSYQVTISLNTVSLSSAAIAVDVVFGLPSGNFTLTATSVTCKGSANGSVNITAVRHMNYTATITGNGLTTTYPFTDSVLINNLAAGSYTLCFTVAGQSAFQLCYTIVITEPKDLSMYTMIQPGPHHLVVINLNGADTYYINLNGTTYTTSENQLTLPLAPGSNNITVTSDKVCQGAIERNITLSEDVLVYPNPFENILNLVLEKDNIQTAAVSVFTSDGRKVYNAKYSHPQDWLKLDLSGLANGLYLLKIEADNSDTILKIIKR